MQSCPTSIPDAGRLAGAGSAALYRELARTLPHCAVFVVDRDLRYVLAEGNGLREAGFDPEDFVGKQVRDAVPPELVDQYEGDYRTLLDGGTFTRRHQVNTRHYHSFGTPLVDTTGKPDLAFVVSYDITEHAQTERRLALLNRLGELADAGLDAESLAADVALLLGEHLGLRACHVADFDPATGRLVGIGPAADALPAALARRLLLRSPTARADGAAWTAHIDMDAWYLQPRVRDGKLAGVFAACRAAGRPWNEDDRAVICVAAERTWSALERMRAWRRLDEANRHKDELLAVLGHELRTPLTSLICGIGLLRREGKADAGMLDVMALQVAQLRRMMDDMLGMSYAQFGLAQLQRAPVALDLLLAEVVEGQQLAAQHKGQRLRLRNEAGAPVVDADRARLAQVFGNLVANAIKYTPPGGAIEVALRRRGPRLEVDVADDGYGLAPEGIGHLFDLFVRGAPGSTGGESGLGVGLWVVKQIVEAHGGAVRAKSDGPGRGSVFTVSLPGDINP